MNLYLYADELRRLFTNREEELHALETYRQRLLEGAPFPYLALFGTRRIGKSLLLKEFVARTLERAEPVLPVYLDLEGQCSSAESFATAYIGAICYWYFTRGKASPWDYLEPAALPGLVAGKSQVAERVVRRLLQERQALRPDRQHLLRLAFAGQRVDGALFGLAGELTLPTFSRVEPYVAADNTWELDALAKNDERWAVEVKWRNRRASYTDVTRIHSKALELNARSWLIAKTGLTPSAAEYARQHGILVSTERELQALAERLGVRFAK